MLHTVYPIDLIYHFYTPYRILTCFLEKKELCIASKELRLGKFLFKFPFIKKQIPIFTVVTSFKCNIGCAYCQYKGLIKENPDMTINAFSEVLKWLSNQNLDYIRLMGGELITHPLINDYLKVLNEYGFRLRFFSTLMVSTKKLRKILPNLDPAKMERFVIHYKGLGGYTKTQYALFLRNVNEVAKKGYTLHLRHNLIDTTTEYDSAIDLASKYNMKYLTSMPLFPGVTGEALYTPVEEWKNLMPHIIDLYKKCKKKGIIFDFSRPLPPCFFTKEEFKRYYHNIGGRPCLRGPALSWSTIYPDQKVVFLPCLHHMKSPKPLVHYKDYRELHNYFKEKFEQLRWKPFFKKCKECKFFEHRMCQGLCLAFKTLIHRT